MRTTVRTLAVPVALATVVAAPAPAAAGDRRAERAVEKRVLKRLHSVTSARCAARRVRGTKRFRLRCRWKAQRRPTPNRLERCSGRFTGTRAGRRVRLRRARRARCRSAWSPLAPWFGFNDNAIRAGQLSAEEDARLTEAVGGAIHRLTFDWRYAEPNPGSFRFAAYDRIYAAMLARGIRPLFVLAFAPTWAREWSLLCSGDCRQPPARRHYPEWRRIAATLAVRYPRAAGIEVWNEPNERVFWHSGPDPERYAEILREAHRGIKEANPSMPVLTGGFSNRYLSDDDGMALTDFLRRTYSSGARRHFDALAFHAYPSGPRLGAVGRALREVKTIAARFGDAGVPLWVTETGISTTDPRPHFDVDLDEQAHTVTEAVRILRRAGVKVVLVHTLLEPDRDSTARGFGLVALDGRPKPAFCHLARLAGTRRPPQGC